MSKLRTLKDIEYPETFGITDSSMFTALLCPSDSLREEAIKWIKALKDDENWIWDTFYEKFKYCKELGRAEYEFDDGEGAIIILKHIFNIENSDLE